MGGRFCILLLGLFVVAEICFSRGKAPDIYDRTPESFDSISLQPSERTQRFYDSIHSKTTRHAVPRFLYHSVFVRPKRDTTSSGQVLDESKIFQRYAGKIIGSITIDREQVFEDGGNYFERLGNKTHYLTRERVIRRDLLFKPGDELDPQLLVRNKQLLRTRSYIYDATVSLSLNELDTTVVDVLITTRDSWTITADLQLRSGGRTMFGVSDANILGTGNLLKVETNFSRSNFDYGGNVVSYSIPNVLGTFYNADFSAGRDFYNSELKLSLHKEFIRPTDYEVGISYNDVKSKYYMVYLDTSTMIKVSNLDVWGGRSKYIKSINSSIFLTGRYGYARHSRRPEVGPEFNPAFHDYDNLLVGMGLYREKFYTANMIYGFGVKEYLATGYKAELVTGYSWGEFRDDMYLGTNYEMGGFTPIGYVMGGFSLGSYINLTSGAWWRSAVDLDLRWFSNLFIAGRSRIRQFLSLNYTQGWNRGTGCDEVICFTDENGPQSFTEHVTGVNRTVLNTETVFFTPYQPLGFRIAFFGFADFALLGNSANMFKNSFYTTLGFGIRIKNERLVFNAIQLRLGVALGKSGFIKNQYVNVSNQTRMTQYRYMPTRPEIVEFE